eukprot:COSAG01_NODE_11836_length_1850_cov_1.913192_2_plen_200_part_00
MTVAVCRCMSQEKDSDDDGLSSADEDGYGEVGRRYRDDDDERDAGDEQHEEAPRTPLDFEAFKQAILTRSQLEKILHEPYFVSATVEPGKDGRQDKGMFVRLSVGVHEATGEKSYRLCEIVGHKDGAKRYTVGKTKTVRLVQLQFGRHRKHFYLDLISSHPPAEDGEFRGRGLSCGACPEERWWWWSPGPSPGWRIMMP